MSADSWSDTTVGSVSRMNKTTVVSGTGAYLASLDKADHKLLHCTATGSGFILDHIYLCSTDGTTVSDLSTIGDHTHAGTQAGLGVGGPFWELIAASNDFIDTGAKYMENLPESDWVEAITGTGNGTQITNLSGYDDSQVLKASTGATSGSSAGYRHVGNKIAWSYPAMTQSIVKLDSTTSQAGKVGFQMEEATAADTNDRKMGHVFCTSVNGNWFGRSADGDSRSDSDMGVAFNTSLTNLKAFHDPQNTRQLFTVNFDDLLTKTTDVPTSGTDTDNRWHWRFTIKNNTAADRIMYLARARWFYYTTTNWTYGTEEP